MIQNLQPQKLWNFFYDLTQIPRPSGKEAEVVQYILDFAEKRKLEAIKDNTGNVIVKKPASKGSEGKPVLVLQSHLDMVPQKNSEKEHDFEKDPIEAIIDGDWVKANGTTLGADNGIGVAAMLALLDSDDITHGPVECLFTIDEETGMTGAFGLQENILSGNMLLNLDTERDGEVIIGCAGGENLSAFFEYKEEDISRDGLPYMVAVKGLKGGHSGIDIHLGRGNAIKILIRFLWESAQKFGIRIASINGGNMRNAIPREAKAEVIIPAKIDKLFHAYVKEYEKLILSETSASEPDFKFEIYPANLPGKVLPVEKQNNILSILQGLPNGVINMEKSFSDVVETSTNLSVVATMTGKISVHCLLRSSIDSVRNHLANRMQSLLALAGAQVERDGAYPGWKPDPDSNILKHVVLVYKKMNGEKPEVIIVHAGLECGIIGSKYPNMEMVSFGPTINHPHSPDEKVYIPSVKRFWDYLVEVLKTI
ncbi:MAG: aminoacyl-histidine dipeptidase [Bacteroidales bacterium]|nr:aminoacyl-histidine dipeptidase [Bacteroidales bacterium]